MSRREKLRRLGLPDNLFDYNFEECFKRSYANYIALGGDPECFNIRMVTTVSPVFHEGLRLTAKHYRQLDLGRPDRTRYDKKKKEEAAKAKALTEIVDIGCSKD